MTLRSKAIFALTTLALATGAGPASARWVISAFPVADASMRSVQAVSASEFHLSGSKGLYAVSKDGGRTWREVAVPGADGLDFRGLAVAGPGAVVLMSSGDGAAGQAKLFRSADGGATWTLAHEEREAGAFFDGIAFWNGRDGLVMGDPVGGAYMVLRTADGGKTWARQKTAMPALSTGEAAFAASNSALTLAPGGLAWMATGGAVTARIFRSTDYGATWKAAGAPIEGGATGGVFGLRFLTATRGVAIGGDHKQENRQSPNIAVTSDGGASWTLARHEGASGLKEGVGRLNARTLLAVGPQGTSISVDDGATWRPVDREAFHAISCAEGACVAVGGRGRVATWVPE